MKKVIQKLAAEIERLFNLRTDKADDVIIDEILRTEVKMEGSKLWVLIFAILIASIGLNINSIAVIIGAMLISPLMGPIMGIGYGIGIYDVHLIKNSLKNLSVSFLICICVSTLYFYITPLSQQQSELLARTSPTIWDVFIAFFGGLAGIIDATRKERTNVTSGVAIATALMPPLCTAGFELINGNWALFCGASYLFMINSVFIALSSALTVRVLRIKHKVHRGQIVLRIKIFSLLIGLLTLIPSIYLAYNFVQKEIFMANANKFVAKTITFTKNLSAQTQVDPIKKVIEVSVIGEYITKDKLSEIAKQLPGYNLSGAKLILHQQNFQQPIDIGNLKNSLLNEIYAKNQQYLSKQENQFQEFKKSLSISQENQETITILPSELRAIFPQISDVTISNTISWDDNLNTIKNQNIIFNIKTTNSLSSEEQTRIKNWLNLRIKSATITVFFENINKTTLT